jgi:hypothetical protein
MTALAFAIGAQNDLQRATEIARTIIRHAR